MSGGLSPAIDTAGVAVITGGASGFGDEAARRCVLAGMRTAVLDVSEAELKEAAAWLTALAGDDATKVLPLRCNVTVQEECQAAQAAVAKERILGRL